MPFSPFAARKRRSAKLDLLDDKSNKDLVSLPEAGICHGQSCGTSAVLGLDNLITAKLDTYDQKLV
jgi:hypothetical protein